MKHLLFSLFLVFLAAAPAWSKPLVLPSNNPARTQTITIKFLIADTADTEAIPVSGFCSVRYQQAGGDDASLYAVTASTTAASSGTLIAAFTSSTTTATTFTAGTRYVKAVATDATVGGSEMLIDCAPLVGAGSGGGGGSFDSCRSGSTQGGGYSAVDGRWAWTCGNYNWHGWRDSTQATSSYSVTCTGDGTPHTSCLHDETRLIGAGLHRIALALQYTRDGGRVYLPEGIYVDNGALLKEDGATNASFPEPYDPEWEARSDFASLGYPTALRVIQIDRGVRLVGEGVPRAVTVDPDDSTVTIHRPKLSGTWIVNDRGTADADPGAGNTLGGVGGDIEPHGQYLMVVGGNVDHSYCETTSNSDPACVTNSTVDAAENAQALPNGANVYGNFFTTLIDYDSSSANLCIPDTDSDVGSDQTDAIGTCSLNRMIRCWDETAAADVARSSGGCDFGAGGDFGVCQAPYEALVADYTTAAQDLQLAMHIMECPDNASSSTHCASPLGHEIYIQDIRVAPGAALPGASCAAGLGSTVQIGNAHTTAASDFNPGIPFPNFYIGGSAATHRIFPIKRGSMDGKGAGFENIGRMPASWLTRNSATAAADCLSGGTIGDTDDEVACDTDTLAAFSHRYGNLIGPNNLFFKVSQADGNKSGVVETYPSGGANDFIGNTIDTHYRQTVVDWGNGTFAWNKITNTNAWSTRYGFAACFSGDCRFENNEFRNSAFSYLYLGQLAAQSFTIKNNTYQNVSNSEPMHYVWGTKNYLVENETIMGTYYSPFAKISGGAYSIQKPTAVFRNIRGFSVPVGVASGTTSGGGQPVAYFIFEGEDDADTNPDDWKSVLIDNFDMISDTSETCLAWFEDDWDNVSAGTGGTADVNSNAREAANRVTIQNSNLTSTSGVIACTAQYDFDAAINDASDSDDWSLERYAPRLINNKVNNAPVPDMLPTISEAGLDADTVPDGTIIRIHDGDATACAHTTGNLTAGSSIATCISDDGGAGDNGTWTEF